MDAALSSATQHAMPPEFGRKWGKEYLNTRFPLSVCRIQREADLIDICRYAYVVQRKLLNIKTYNIFKYMILSVLM